MKVIHLGHSSVLIKGEQNILIDPFVYKGAIHVDWVFWTHKHFDHFTILPQYLQGAKIRHLAPGEVLTGEGWKIKGMEARAPLHPRGSSYLLEMGGYVIFHSGDTTRLKEFDDLSVDVALLTIDYNYGMNEAEAVCLSRDMGAKYMVPLHWGYLPESPKKPALLEYNREVEL